MTTDKLGVYIHIPFCASKCHYCDFCSQSTRDIQRMEKYTDALINEIKAFSQGQGKRAEVDTVYFGGGTPSLLPASCFEKILCCLRECFAILPDAEITAEANPKTADAQKLFEMRGLGINRLSIGMQSVHDNELRALGRIHGFCDFERFYADAREVGFDNISVDLMYGIPQQSIESFETSVRTLAAMSPEHISSYCLKIEEGTRFFEKKDTLPLPDEDSVCDMYTLMGEILSGYGYEKYEISNFSRHGLESVHNRKYWTCDNYIGFGAGAHSYFANERFSNSRDIDAYIQSGGLGCREDIEYIDVDTAENEYVMLGMRLTCGVSIFDYEKKFSKKWSDKFGSRFEKFMPEFVREEDGCCKFTEKGMFVSSYVLSEVLDF